MNYAIRVDATTRTGTGHLMRCLALAEGVKDRGGEVLFITHCESEGLINRLKKETFRIQLLNKTDSLNESLAVLAQENPDWIVLDGYHFDTNYQKAVKALGCKVLIIDDHAHLEHYHADIILNQNYGSEKLSYNAEPYTKLLLGTKHVLLRREFLEYASFKRTIPGVARKILVTMGGSDPENLTLEVLKAINLVESPVEVRAVIGATNPHYAALFKETNKDTHDIRMLTNVGNMAPVMAWADIAIFAGGTTIWELTFMCLPTILCILDNNLTEYNDKIRRGSISSSLKWVTQTGLANMVTILSDLIQDSGMRETMGKRSVDVVDGRGVSRVLAGLESYSCNLLPDASPPGKPLLITRT